MAKISPSPQDWKEARRRRAFELAQQGWKQRRIAEALGVSEAAVSQWMAAVHEQGYQALCARPHPGGPCKLTNAQLRMIPRLLSHGAEAYGFRGEVLTCARIAKIVEWELGVSYSKSHISRLMKQLKWTPQTPLERASQRDEDQIEHWRTKTWFELKKRLAGSTANLFLWTNRAFICCPRELEPMRRLVKHRSCESFNPTIIYPS